VNSGWDKIIAASCWVNRLKRIEMPELVLLRHGQSIWNLENRYTGWTDVNLSEKGIFEAYSAGKMLCESGGKFDWAITSVLKRAVRTLWIVLDQMDATWLPVEKDWRLNERHYGSLQGLNKAESVLTFGKEQVFQWRRSFDTRPPALDLDDPRHPVFDPRYTTIPFDLLPAGESLADTQQRVLPCWQQQVLPRLQAGQRVLLVAHGNSLRALVTYLNDIPLDKVPDLNVPTGIPWVLKYDQHMRMIGSHYLGDPAAVEVANAAARSQWTFFPGI
jgi:2,3-bisphosphoglycerate-dependent phosphoglycerate mutase